MRLLLGAVRLWMRCWVWPCAATMWPSPSVPPPARAFADEEGRQTMARLVEAAGAFTDRPEGLPMGLRQDLRSLLADAERCSGGWDPAGRLGGSQLAVLRDWSRRPALPDTDDGHHLQVALDAFLDHALAHGYEPAPHRRHVEEGIDDGPGPVPLIRYAPSPARTDSGDRKLL